MKINLIHQNTAKFRRAETIKKANSLVVIASVGLFLIGVVTLAGQLVYYKLQADELNKTLSSLQLSLNSRFDDAVSYLKVKQQAVKINEIESKRVKFKEYLFALYSLTPPSANIANLSFDPAGIIQVTFKAGRLADYQSFLNNIQIQTENESYIFSEFAQSKYQRNPDGTLQANIDIKVK